MLGTFVRDARYGVRSLLAAPRFAGIAIATLALGIGVNTAVFSVVDAVLLRPLPYTDSDRLVMVWDTTASTNARTGSASYPDFLDWKENSHVFAGMAAYRSQSFNLAANELSERVDALRISPELFGVLRVYPEVGRSFSEDDQQPGRNHVAVITHALWQRLFGGRDEILGQSLSLDAEPYTIIGVLPAGFQSPPAGTLFNADLVVPLVGVPLRGAHILRVIARLRGDATLKQAQAEMDLVANQLARQYPDTNGDRGVNVVRVYDQVLGNIRPSLLALLGAVGFVLLISCASVSSLVLSRAVLRQRELGIRMALGATRGRLIQQLLTESVLLAILGGSLGFILTILGTPLIAAIIPNNVPRAQGITLDSNVLAFTMVISVVAGIAFGTAPALQFSRPAFSEKLMEGGRNLAGGSRRNRMRSLLVVSEVALAFTLLIAAGLMLKSFVRLQRIDPGFSNMNVLTMAISLPRSKYSQPPLRAGFFQRAIEGTEAVPGVESVGVVNTLPLSGFDQFRSITIDGNPRTLSDTEASAGYRVVSRNYFQVMGISLLSGRAFTERDDAASAGVAIINDEMARHFWPDGDPLGKRLTISPEERPVEIVGVVGSVSHQGLDVERGPEVYVPYLQRPEMTMFLLVRAGRDPYSVIAPVREQVRTIDTGQPVYNIMTMAQRLAESTASRRFPMLLMSIFAGGALLITVTGIYGLVSYSVAQRTREIGIRMALGAQPHEVLNPILRQGMMLILTGLVIGLALALGLTRVLSHLLFEVTPTDLSTFIGAATVLSLVAFLGNYIPARKATKVDPMLVLRSE